jgi:hypothetical protein
MPARLSLRGVAATALLALICAAVTSSPSHAAKPCEAGLASAIEAAETSLASGRPDAQAAALGCLLTALQGLEARLATIEADIVAPPRLIAPTTVDLGKGRSISVRGKP